MSVRRSPSRESRRRSFAHEQAGEFESTILHAEVYRGILDDAQLTRLCEAAVATADAGAARERAFGADAEFVEDVDRSKVGLAWTATARAAEVIAEVCARIIRDRPAGDADALREAREEARRWLQMHLDAAERAGVAREVGGRW